VSQVPEESYTYAQFRQTFKKRFEFERPTIIASDGDGTHFFWDDARGERHFGVISDLVAAKIIRTGSETGTILANGLSVTITKTLSPAFTSAQIGQLRVWANARGASSAFGVTVSAILLVAQPQLRMLAWRQFSTANLTVDAGGTSPTDNAATYPTDTVADVPGGHAHATDSLGSDVHGHTIPTHTHGLTYTQGSAAVTVDWWIATRADF